MRSRATRLLAVGAAIALAACAGCAHPPSVLPPPAAAAGGPLRVEVGGVVRSIPLEDYVAGCVLAELGTPAAEAARAARTAREMQAILCRSYAVAARNRHASGGFDLCSTTHCQVYRAADDSSGGRLARGATDETRGVILAYRGVPIRPLYHAHCGGRTSPAQEVWPGQAVPWLGSIEDPECRRDPRWQFTTTLESLGRALAAVDGLAFRPPLRRVEIARRDVAGRAAAVRLVGSATTVVDGDRFRSALQRAFGPRSLRSTLFEIRTSASRLTFAGRGMGHGVGLCQAGAVRLAARGRSVESILRRYFPGAVLAGVD